MKEDLWMILLIETQQIKSFFKLKIFNQNTWNHMMKNQFKILMKVMLCKIRKNRYKNKNQMKLFHLIKIHN